jgi:hypothetical protein
MKYAIFTALYSSDDIIYANALGKSLKYLEVTKYADIICICSSDIKNDPTINQLTTVWTRVLAHESSNKHVLNILVGHLYINPDTQLYYNTVIYVDPKTVFFESPKILFNITTPASMFNSISSSYMIKLYDDILGRPTNPKHKRYTMGHLHPYGYLENNVKIDNGVIKQAIDGRYAMTLTDDSKIDDESKVQALDSRFMVYTPEPAFYQHVVDSYDSINMDSDYLLGSIFDKTIMIHYHNFMQSTSSFKQWNNITHNFRVPLELIKRPKYRNVTSLYNSKIIYRKDTIEGLISAENSIYSVEAFESLSLKICELDLNNVSEFMKLAPTLEQVSYVSSEHCEECKKLD